MYRRLRSPLYVVCILALITASFLITLAIPPSKTHAATSKKLVLAGGGLDSNDGQIYQTIVRLAGGPDVARIGVITAAGGGEERGALYSRLFTQTYGAAHAEWIPIDLDRIENNSSPDVIRQINSMTGFFFGGGQQTRLIESFYLSDRSESPALTAIRQKYEQGAVISGSSAGAAIQTNVALFTPGGESYESFRYGPFTKPVNKNDYMYYDPLGGFKFFSYGLIDTHFSERGRQGRLISVGLDAQQVRGFGIDEDTALVVTDADTPDARMQVIGEGGVTIVDLSQVHIEKDKYTSAYGARMTYLTQDDIYAPATGTITFAPWKSVLIGEQTFKTKTMTSSDIFSSPDNDRDGAHAFTNLAIRLFQSSITELTGNSHESRPTYEVKMTKSTDALAAAYSGSQNSEDFYSYQNLLVDIYTD